MSGSSRGEHPRAAPLLGVAVASLFGAVLLSLSIERVVRRLGFDYDLVLWADDYLMTSMMKLAAGTPVYTPIADANSTIYAPGGAYLHYAILGPLGLATSVLANKVLVQVWLAVGVAVSTRVVIEISRRGGRLPEGRLGLAVFAGAAALTLALAAYTNPMADSLHPTTLETCVLAAAALVLARWDGLDFSKQIAAALLLPALGLLAKQSSGVAVAATLAGVALLSGSGRRRAVLAAAPLVALALATAALVWWTDGLFKVWAVDILAAHPFDWWKASDLYSGYGLLFTPVLAVVVVRSVIAARRLDAGDRAWLRVASLGAAYTPLALAALFKKLGGPNNLGMIGFFLTLLAAPALLEALAGSRQGGVRRFAFVVLVAQLGIWYPRRRVPDARDYQNAETVCSYAADRMRCGDQVLVGRGSVCYRRGGVAVPRDRVMSLIEVTAAGRGNELGFYQRIADEEYDLLIMPINDLFWFGKPLWEKVQGKYKAFHMTRGEAEGDFWYHGWQGFSSRPIVFFERVVDAGSHSVDEAGRRCQSR